MTFTLDQLGQRLRELPIAAPDSDAVTAHVLAAARRAGADVAPRRRPILTVVVRPIAATLAALVGAWAVLYASPAAGAALAEAPGVGSVSSFVLENAGLGSGTSVTAEDAAAVHSGVTVRLVGASADSIRTVLLVRISPADYNVVGATLSDQFGTSYEELGGYGDLRTGDWALIFAPPSFAAAPLGMRFTLSLNIVRNGEGSVLPGAWRLNGTVLSHAGHTVAAPQSATIGQATVYFTPGTESDGVLQITAHVRGLSPDQIGLSKNAASGGLTVTVSDSSGRQLHAPTELLGEPGGWAIDIIAYGVTDHGRYTIVISIPGVGSVERRVAL
jgi:hypothetical protein